MRNTINIWGGGYTLLAVPWLSGGGARDRDDRCNDALNHRQSISGGDYNRLCNGDRPKYRCWLRDGMAAYRGRAGTDCVGYKQSCGLYGRRTDPCADRGGDAQPLSCYCLFTRRQSIACRHGKCNVSRVKHGINNTFNKINGEFCVLRNSGIICRSKCTAQQHAAIHGRLSLEAHSIKQATRKGAARK